MLRVEARRIFRRGRRGEGDQRLGCGECDRRTPFCQVECVDMCGESGGEGESEIYNYIYIKRCRFSLMRKVSRAGCLD